MKKLDIFGGDIKIINESIRYKEIIIKVMINSNRETSKIGRLEDLERILYPYVEPGSKSVLPFVFCALSSFNKLFP